MHILDKLDGLKNPEQRAATLEALRDKYSTYACASIKDVIRQMLAANHIAATQIRYYCSDGVTEIGITGVLSDKSVTKLMHMGSSGATKASSLLTNLYIITPPPEFIILHDWRIGCSSACIMHHHRMIIRDCEKTLSTGMQILRNLCERAAGAEYVRLSLDANFELFLEDGGFDIDENGNILE